MTALGCLCFCSAQSLGRRREEALRLPFSLRLELLQKGRRVTFTTLTRASALPPQGTDTLLTALLTDLRERAGFSEGAGNPEVRFSRGDARRT